MADSVVDERFTMNASYAARSSTTTISTHSVARITVVKSSLVGREAAVTTVSSTGWTYVQQRANTPARLHELINSLSPTGRQAFDEARAVISARLKAKVDSGEISRLAYFRSVARITQARLAELSGIPQPNISKLERTGQVSLRMAAKLAPALGISVSELLGLREGADE